MWRQTSGWVTYAKPSRQNTDPGVSHTFNRRFLNQNYPKYICNVVSKILEEKKQLSNVLFKFVIFLKLGVLWWKLKIFITNFSLAWVSVVSGEKGKDGSEKGRELKERNAWHRCFYWNLPPPHSMIRYHSIKITSGHWLVSFTCQKARLK